MNNLAPMKNCPGGVQGNLNWMPGYNCNCLDLDLVYKISAYFQIKGHNSVFS